MTRTLLLLLAAVLLALFYTNRQVPEPGPGVVGDTPVPAMQAPGSAEGKLPATGTPGKAVLDVTVHTIEELQVLFDRAEQLAMTPQPPGEKASVILVLHGPEVEFFSISNYDRYKEIVDQAARLDAFDVVDVKICQTMMEIRGIPRDDIPPFIDQVPLGSAEVERLLREGYVYF